MLRFLRKLQEITAAGAERTGNKQLGLQMWDNYSLFLFVFGGGGVILILYNKNISLKISEA